MTESEAIKELQDNVDLPFGSNVSDEASKIAIQALEKQIPRKRDSYNCPVCSHYFEDGECFTYCPECGQRLER